MLKSSQLNFKLI